MFRFIKFISKHLILYVGLYILVVSTFFGLIIGLDWYAQLPAVTSLQNVTYTSPSRIYDRNGKLLYELVPDKVYYPISISNVSPYLKEATLAVEDANFYNHHGLDIRAISRAAYYNYKNPDQSMQGASTITQQLVKNILLSSEKTYVRKIKEAFLAYSAELKYSKEEILEMYLNNISYGGNAYGIEAASQKYFGKSADKLDLAESSMLAGLPSAPSVYSPLVDPEKAKIRQLHVLDRMVEENYITRIEADEAYSQNLVYMDQNNSIDAPHFVEFVKDKLQTEVDPKYLKQGGLTITTTLDSELQSTLQEKVKKGVEKNSYLNISNGAAIVLDNSTNGILAYIGSVDYYKDSYGAYDVLTATRQPGSSIKPLTYALALSNGYTPASIIQDKPLTINTYGEIYKPVNYDGKFHGNVTLRSALANSYNIPAVTLVQKLGVEKLVKFGMDMGLSTWELDSNYGPSITLGGRDTRLVDLVGMYSTFARGGTYKEVTPFISITDKDGKELYAQKHHMTAQVVSPEVSYLITDILSDNNARTPSFGPRSALYIPNAKVAVKTGTTDQKRDNLTIGYTAGFTVGVWVGNNDNTPMNPRLASGLSGAAPIWNDLTTHMIKEYGAVSFKMPENVVRMADPTCANTSELFVKGSEMPKRLCVVKKTKG